MKRLYVLFLIVVLIFSLTACNEDLVKGSIVSQASDTTAELDIMPQKLFELAEIGDIVVVTAGNFKSEMPLVDKLIAEEPIELYNRLDGMQQERPKRLLPLAHAWDALSEWILLEDSVGCCVAEFVNLYPPGVPILVPGEQMSETICRSLFQYLKEGLNVQGIRIEFTKDGNAVYKIRAVNQKEN